MAWLSFPGTVAPHLANVSFFIVGFGPILIFVDFFTLPICISIILSPPSFILLWANPACKYKLPFTFSLFSTYFVNVTFTVPPPCSPLELTCALAITVLPSGA